MHVRNINEAFHLGLLFFNDEKYYFKRMSRNGMVREYSTPILISYKFPAERVLFHAKRNANPFFHFFEGLWMIAGRNDIALLKQFNKRMVEYSDDQQTLNGAYGYRWRHTFGRDQLRQAIDLLSKNPNDRRVVLQMWNPEKDLGSTSKDVPCNTQIMFKVRDLKGIKAVPSPLFDGSVLDMTVINRSNDMLWGAFGANVVHFSMVHEYVATMAGYGLGRYYHFSNNFHVYEDVFEKFTKEAPQFHADEYELGEVKSMPLISNPYSFYYELQHYLNLSELHLGVEFSLESKKAKSLFKNKVFNDVATPMYNAWVNYKENNIKGAIKYAKKIKAEDWKKACVEWLERKKTKV
jgi:thymidylate synthase